MAKRKFVVGKMSFEEVAQEIEKYQQSLDKKCQLLVERLAKKGKTVVATIMKEVYPEDRGKYTIAINYDTQGNMQCATLQLSGDKVLFIEFSAGITHGTSSYPLPSGSGYGMGTYPSEVKRQNPNYPNWANPNGWWYYDENGESQYSFGNKAYMPMYHADQKMISELVKTAQTIFRK